MNYYSNFFIVRSIVNFW